MGRRENTPIGSPLPPLSTVVVRGGGGKGEVPPQGGTITPGKAVGESHRRTKGREDGRGGHRVGVWL